MDCIQQKPWRRKYTSFEAAKIGISILWRKEYAALASILQPVYCLACDRWHTLKPNELKQLPQEYIDKLNALSKPGDDWEAWWDSLTHEEKQLARMRGSIAHRQAQEALQRRHAEDQIQREKAQRG